MSDGLNISVAALMHESPDKTWSIYIQNQPSFSPKKEENSDPFSRPVLSTVLNEISQQQKDKYYIISLLLCVKNLNSCRESQTVIARV